MGGESSSLKGCTLDSHYDLCSQTPWNVYSGTTSDGSKVSVFVYDKTSISEEIIENCVKYFKVLRHPGLVRLLGADDKGTELWLITEPVRPLEHVLDTLLAEEVAEGLYTVLNTLDFLHQKAKVCHNNLSSSCIFLAEDGSWKLSSLELVTSFTAARPSFLSKGKAWRSADSIAPEEKAERYQLTEALGHTRDVFALGQLVKYLAEAVTFPASSEETFFSFVEEKCLNTDPRDRPQFQELLELPLFQSDFICIMEFLRQITLHSELERAEFFKGLVPRLLALPPQLVASRLFKPLLGRFVMVDDTAREHLLPHLLTPCKGQWHMTEKEPKRDLNPILPEALFRKYAIPELFKIFYVRDAHVRIMLLRCFSSYSHLFERNMLKAVIIPQILLSARDTNDELVSLSLHALGHLVMALGGNSVMGPQRIRIFTDGIPKARAGPVSANQKQLQLNGTNISRAVITTSQNKKNDVDIEEKRQDKEKRREDMRRKAEERKQNRIKKSIGLVANKLEGVKVEADDGGPADLNKSHHSTSSNNTNTHLDETSLAAADATQDQSNCDFTDLNQSQQMDDEDEAQSEQSISGSVTDSDIDREIEEELQAMEPSQGFRENPRLPVDEVKVDWSDVAVVSQGAPDSSSRKKSQGQGALTLKSGKPHQPSVNPAEATPSATKPPKRTPSGKQMGAGWGSWEDSWENTEDSWVSEETPRTLTSPTASHNERTLGGNQSSKPKLVMDETCLDIKAAEISVVEPDFFADMAPKLELRNSSNLLDLLPGVEGKQDEETRSSKFHVQQPVQPEGQDDVNQWEEDDWPDV